MLTWTFSLFLPLKVLMFFRDGLIRAGGYGQRVPACQSAAANSIFGKTLNASN
jgi:hypothetical protein